GAGASAGGPRRARVPAPNRRTEKASRLDLQGFPFRREIGDCEGPSPDWIPPRQGVSGPGHSPDRRGERRYLERRRARRNRRHPRVVAAPERHRPLHQWYPTLAREEPECAVVRMEAAPTDDLRGQATWR